MDSIIVDTHLARRVVKNGRSKDIDVVTFFTFYRTILTIEVKHVNCPVDEVSDVGCFGNRTIGIGVMV